MQNNILHIQENEHEIQVELEVTPKAIWVQAITFLMFLFTALTALLFLRLTIMSWSSFEFSFLLGMLLMGLVAWYFLKLFLWNRGGKEFFRITENKIITYSDYQLFLQNKRTYNFKYYHLVYWDTDGSVNKEDGNILDDLSEEGQAILGFELDNGIVIDTTVEIPFHELRRLGDVLKKKHVRKHF